MMFYRYRTIINRLENVKNEYKTSEMEDKGKKIGKDTENKDISVSET